MMGRAFIRDKQPWEGREAAGLGRGLRPAAPQPTPPSADEAPLARSGWASRSTLLAAGGGVLGAKAGLCGWGHMSFV